jgi:hypothetical protein
MSLLLIVECIKERVQPFPMVGWVSTASRTCWYGSPPSIAICSVEMTSPALWPSSAAPRIKSVSASMTAFHVPVVS